MAISRLLRSALLIAGACAPAALLGCGSSSARVTGAITINGLPPKLKGMGISFMAPDGRSESAAVAEDGSYKAERVPVGQVTVAFLYIPAATGATEGATQPAKGGRGAKLPKPGGGDDAPDIAMNAGMFWNPIPQQLRDASTSKVTYKVQGGKENVFNYDIKP